MKFSFELCSDENLFSLILLFFNFVEFKMSQLVPKAVALSQEFVKYATPRLKLAWYYSKVELVPPKPSDIPEIKNAIVKLIQGYNTGAWKQVTVKNAFINALVTTEVVGWFFIGECIGKGHFIGYKLS